MSNLALYASPIDFHKNEELEQKITQAKRTKLNINILKKITTPKEEEINEIHQNLKEDNDETLADFYSSEMEEDLKKKINNSNFKQDLYQNEKTNSDYLISNNLKIDEIPKQYSNMNTNDELLTKLNYIISMFEEQKEIKTNQKNEEVVLYCFLGIFVIYVLDSFVSIGKYKR